ncbi:hypothetical protein ASD83_01590 [Devosia sp. Root685]|uniref:hypothetical protein n=1 Tax=Devosia sp. Root685 TaxID=1736587 RepID=UPI0006F3265B|nr:hypothetical protein [Devosia sp. Root685]KRA99249.1 hypothetical protein ASD83_01590 [Devosia sp. Root685]
MTTTFTKTIAAAVTALLIGISPAMAGGQISIGFAPSDPDQAQALGLGLRMFSVVQGMSANGGNAFQNGNFNAAGFNQNGSNNSGLIVQNGNGHNGTISQNGNNNTCGLFQFGEATNAQCQQNGNGQSGITTVFGF